MRDLLLELADQELEHPGVQAITTADKRQQFFSSLLHQLTMSLGTLDKERAFPVLTEALFKLDDAEARRVLANRAIWFKR